MKHPAFRNVLWEPCGFQKKTMILGWSFSVLRSLQKLERVPLFGIILIITRLSLQTTPSPGGLAVGLSQVESWGRGRVRPTFTFALVLDFQFRLLFTSGLEECTFIAVGFSVQPTDWAFPGDVRTIWGADAAGFVLLVHSAFFPGPTVHVLARF